MSAAARHEKMSPTRIFTIRRKNGYVAISRLPGCSTKTTAASWQEKFLELTTMMGPTHHKHLELIVRGVSDARITKFFAHVLYGSLFKAVKIKKYLKEIVKRNTIFSFSI
jgi:hypothetical protein